MVAISLTFICPYYLFLEIFDKCDYHNGNKKEACGFGKLSFSRNYVVEICGTNKNCFVGILGKKLTALGFISN